MMNKLLSTILLGSLTAVAVASAGDWSVYPSVASYKCIEQLGDRYYLLNGNTLVYADTADIDVTYTLSRMDGLNGTNVYDIVANCNTQNLAIVYEDGNIDLMDVQGAIHNLPDYANHVITGDRTLLGIGVSADSLFIRTAFGGLLVDMRQVVIRTTLYDNVEGDLPMLERMDKIVAAHKADTSLSGIMEQMTDINGTQVHQAAQMHFMHGRLYTIQSTFNDYVNYQWGAPVISILDTYTGQWMNVSSARLDPMIRRLDPNGQFHKMTGIAPDPNDPDHYAVSSLSGGIYELRKDSLVGYYNAFLNPKGVLSLFSDNDKNKTVYSRVGALRYDENGYLWFANGNKEQEMSLHSMSPTGKFTTYKTEGFSGFYNNQYSIFGRLNFAEVSRYHFKWIVRTFHINSPAVCLYYDGGTPEDVTDDECKMFSTITDQDGNSYNPTYYRDIVEDRDGAMWLLTSIGPFVIDDQYNAYKNPGQVRRIKIPRNDGTNLADYLLNEVSCRCMVVDMANRKWIGTDDAGLYLLSADGMTQLEHFTTDNSPLFSNRIAGLTMDEETGTLYIGTDGGICAYQTDVLTDVEDNSGLYCYPNPVRVDYTGDLTITGFKMGSSVTITDANHHAVFREKNDGSIIHWNLEGNDGRRIRPGVYYIDAIEEDGKKGGTFKFLVL